MTSQDVTINDGTPRGGGVHPNCPQCQSRMRVKQISPTMLATDVDDVLYGCERCGTEAKRTVKRS